MEDADLKSDYRRARRQGLKDFVRVLEEHSGIDLSAEKKEQALLTYVDMPKLNKGNNILPQNLLLRLFCTTTLPPDMPEKRLTPQDMMPKKCDHLTDPTS